MAYLLGSKACIDSLRIDIDDLQNVIYDIVGKTGSIKCHSWKFPDKLATDVDINELLERYQYGKNEVDNQVSHVVLFEIIIDRLLLVLHGSWRYLHEIQTKLLPNTIDSSSTINQQTSLSVGLVVKKYWNKLLHIFATLQQHKIRPNDIEKINHKRSKSNLTTDKHCQTIQTSFSPCSSCIKLQQCFHDYSDNIINLCNIYNLPSSLAYHRCSASAIPEWLSLDDINQWFDYQIKDFDRLSKHLEYLNNTLNKTKTDLDLSENHCKQQNETNQCLQQIILDEKQSKKNLQEVHEKKFIEIKKQYDEQIKLLTIQKTNLEQQLKEINNECNSRGEQLQKLESSKTELKILTEDRLKSDELIKTFEQNHIRLQTELDVVKRDLDERNRDLKKERIRIENMIRQEENHQSKQKILTKSYDELSQECQSLKKQITELEFQREQLQKTNNHILQEVNSLKSNLNQQINEREQNNDLNRPPSDKVVHDMQNEMRTHELRIDFLQKENDSLKTSLEKLLISNTPPIVTEERYEELRNQSRQEQSYRQYSHANETVTTKTKQTPLWLLNNEILEQQQAFTETKPVITTNYIPRFSENDYAANGWITSDPDVPQQQDHTPITVESRPATRVQSSRTLTLTIPPASDNQMNLGKGRTKISNRPLSFEHTRRNITSGKARRSSTTNITHRCTSCNKSYDDKHNYDIHKLYCRT